MTVAGLRARVVSAAHGMRSAGGTIARAIQRATNASGAGRSGLAGMIRLHTANQAGDALVAVGLAGTLFFGVPVGDARGRVALYLLVTMAPFAVVAPLIGPALDKMRGGRRYALAGTMLARGLLCWALASAVLSHDIVTLFPAAFGVLVLTKAYSVARSAVIPRVLPGEISLVKANARMSLAGTVGAGVAGVVGAGLAALVGPAWTLRVTALAFLAATALAVRLPSHVDSDEPASAQPADAEHPPGDRDSTAGPDPGQWAEEGAASGDPADDSGDTEPASTGGRTNGARPASTKARPRRVRLSPAIAEALRANAALRAFSGFLILFFAFLVRVAGFPGVPSTVALGLLVVLAGAGGMAGTSIGAWTRSRAPELLVLGTLALATAVAAVSAWLYGLVAAAAVALVAGLGQALGKLGLDALIQRDVDEEVRSSAFARSETVLQLSWVVGGGLGLAVSLAPSGTLGLAIIAAVLATALGWLMVARRRRRVATRRLADVRGRVPDTR